MKHVVVPIELVDYPLDSFTNKLREMFGDNVDNSDAELIYEAATAAAPDTGMIAVDKVTLSTLIEYANIDWSYELKKEPIGSADHAITEDTYQVFLDALAKIKQALKDMEGNHG